MLFIPKFVFFFKKAEEEAIKVKRTHVRLETINHNIYSLNINMSEKVYVKARKSFSVSHQFVWNNIFPWISIKYTKPGCLMIWPPGIIWKFSYLSSCKIIVVCNIFSRTLGIPNAFTGNLRVSLGGTVDKNMVSTLSHFGSFGLE